MCIRDRPGWPEQVRLMQKNWIGKSTGVRFAFPYDLDGKAEKLWVLDVYKRQIAVISMWLALPASATR